MTAIELLLLAGAALLIAGAFGWRRRLGRVAMSLGLVLLLLMLLLYGAELVGELL
jgi:hypothetical protein